KGDLLKLEHEGEERIMRVFRLAVKAKLFYLAGHREGGKLQARHENRDDPFRWFFASFGRLRELRARKVSVDILGRVRDPGPPK
ncbi:MAG: hypothetical protein IIA44_11840, partial [Acidobacteria bacterium]|nr:hypothetical protein [Acidobacteriota bacterium]